MTHRHELEIERKFWVIRPGSTKSVPLAMAEFQARLVPLLADEPLTQLHIFDGYDIYFAKPDDPTTFVRIRRNMLRQEITAKRVGDQGTELREEENLKVNAPEDSQAHFLTMLGFARRFMVRQSGNIYVMPGKVEVVIYWTERLPDHTDASVFVEIEALGGNTIDEAMALLNRYQEALGLPDEDRCEQSIFQLYDSAKP